MLDKIYHAMGLISIHALREEGDHSSILDDYDEPISIHALREEGDDSENDCTVWRLISIHALREEGDKRTSECLPTPRNFYPRPPRGGRHKCMF